MLLFDPTFSVNASLMFGTTRGQCRF